MRPEHKRSTLLALLVSFCLLETSRAEETLAVDLLDNGDFEEASPGLRGRDGLERIPWWKSSGGASMLEGEEGKRSLVTRGGEWVRQPVAAYAPLAERLVVRGRISGTGSVTLIDGSGKRATIELPADSDEWRAFELTGAQFREALGAPLMPRFELELSAPERAAWDDLVFDVVLPAPTEAELRELIGAPNEIVAAKIENHLDSFARDFLARCPFLVLGTSDQHGALDASPKGDAPGFVLVEDEGTIVIPDRPGNKLALGHLNVLSNPQVGVIFMIPGTPETLRINGRAELSRDPALLERLAARGRPAVLAIRVRIDQVFFHCAKAFIRSNLWKPEKWGEPHHVSFGEIFAAKTGAGDDAAKAYDAQVEKSYQEQL